MNWLPKECYWIYAWLLTPVFIFCFRSFSLFWAWLSSFWLYLRETILLELFEILLARFWFKKGLPAGIGGRMLSDFVVGRISDVSQQESSSCLDFSLVLDVSLDLEDRCPDWLLDLACPIVLFKILLFLLRWLKEVYRSVVVWLLPNDSASMVYCS